MHAISPSLFPAPHCNNSSQSSLHRPPLFISSKSSLSVKCRRPAARGVQQGRLREPQDETSSSKSQFPEGQMAKVFVGHTIYKGNAALTVEPKPPEFSSLDSGAYKISKEGFILLQFAPAAVARQYDWNKKQVFSLSVPEIGTLMSLGDNDSCEFFHDPFIGRSDEGKVKKLLKAEALPDGSGHVLNLSVKNRILDADESVYITITKGEFAALKSAFHFIIPHLLGWHTFGSSIRPEDSGRPSNNRTNAELEWSR
ncbi:single-stranded DNA-binding protein WHY1, chloroplastic-like [Wolffia australiana]